MQSVGSRTYSKAVSEGKYDLYLGNLFGKYDNVRTYWEDRLTRIALRPYLRKLVDSCQEQNRGVRIVDLGCGAGQGYQILTLIDRQDLDLGLQHQRVLPEENIETYLGLDISQAMVEKGNEIFEDKSNVSFARADLSEGLGKLKTTQSPFDIYFSSYASLSHLSRKDLVTLLQDICQHGHDNSVVVLDFVGRYSIEWPDYWSAQTETEKVRDYSMSYLYSEATRKHLDIESFPLRFWTGREVKQLTQEISEATGIEIEVLELMDRSVMVGRHTDTREYNSLLKPIRRSINSLHEDYMRTDLQELILDPRMIPKHSEIAPFLRQLVESWNIVVEYCQQRLCQNISLVNLQGWHHYSKPLQFALMTIDRVIADVSWMWYGDPRANIIEPQLGYALRTLEYEMQQGLGCGHGLVAILKISK
ncbi:class I SAM-dependent methyltransferase [Myxosarcina sp. GI1]|uniref:class I SAM-dependent methyltransferase n=1 Tax=Myxosarcina sp. GI1 TaxID=1541065 RepID=UPI000567C9AE|nr:class I SAM-dependent methyltransferase [Myxosarcina sp. GI1]